MLNLGSDDIVNNLDTLIQHGADVNQIAEILKFVGYDTTKYLDTLIQHGANIDIDNLVLNLGSDDIVNNLDTLIQHGADINQIAEILKFFGYDTTKYLAKYGYTE